MKSITGKAIENIAEKPDCRQVSLKSIGMSHFGLQMSVADSVSRAVGLIRVSDSFESFQEARDMLEAIPPSERSKESWKLLGEVYFLIGLAQRRKGDVTAAQEAAHKSIAAYEAIKMRDYNDAIPILDWLLPDLMHEGVVKARLLAPA